MPGLPDRMENGKLPAYAWPGGYPLFYVCADDGILCPECANSDGQTTDPDDKQWYLVNCDANYEDDGMYCDHCNKRIESAYGDPDEEPDDAPVKDSIR